MEQELDRRGRRLGDLDPVELAELATMIDSPELHEIALRLKAGLEQQGRAFEDLTAEELTALSAPSRSEQHGSTLRFVSLYVRAWSTQSPNTAGPAACLVQGGGAARPPAAFIDQRQRAGPP